MSLNVSVETKTKDNVFVNLVVEVQYRVLADKVEACYMLQDPEQKIKAFVFDLVRTQVPLLDLDDVFSKKDDIAIAIKNELDEKMPEFGYEIIKAQVTDVNPDANVKAVMNEINTAQPLRITATEKDKAIKAMKAKLIEDAVDKDILESIAKLRQPIIRLFSYTVIDYFCPKGNLYTMIKGSIRRKHFSLALTNLRHYKEFNKYNKWNRLNNRHELEFLNVIRNYNKEKSNEDKFTFVYERGESKINIDVTDDPVENYEKKKQYIEDLKVIYKKVSVKRQLNDPNGGKEWKKKHPLRTFIVNLIISSENEYCYSNTNIHEKSMEDLNDIPYDLFSKPSIHIAYGNFINHIYERYIANSNNQASDLEKKKAAECLLRAVKNINKFDYTTKSFSLTKLLKENSAYGKCELIRVLRNEEDKLDKISNFIKNNAISKTEKSKKQIKKIDLAMRKLGYEYRNAPRFDHFISNNRSNNGENNEGNNGENNEGNNRNDDGNIGNVNSNDRYEGSRTSRHTGKGKLIDIMTDASEEEDRNFFLIVNSNPNL
ncbi:band 7 family-domain-containing protein [Neocallimastix sp. 'constans']